MAIANLDYEDLHILLVMYEKRQVELKQKIEEERKKINTFA